MKRAMLTVVLATSVVMIGRAAQAPPNLSGTWRPQNPMSGQVEPVRVHDHAGGGQRDDPHARSTIRSR